MLCVVQSDHTAITIGLRKKVLAEEEQWLWWYTPESLLRGGHRGTRSQVILSCRAN